MALQGNEILYVVATQPNGQPAATQFPTTTGAIAALASLEGAPFIVTPITTVGNGTLTAAGLVGGEIVRSGPVAAFSDATDTAVNIIAALPGAVVGSSFSILIKNSTAFTQTITAGTGVTLPNTVITPAFSVNNYIATLATASTLTLVHIDTTTISVGTNSTAPSITTISTVGAGTLTAAAFVGGLIARSGSQSGTPFTDTTDTAANIIAACANLVNKIGTSMLIEYSNTTNAIATVTGGTGVTVSGVSIIPSNTISQFLLTYTAAATMTLVGLGVTQSVATQITILGSSSGQTILQATAAAGAGTLTLPTVTAGTIASTSGTNLYIADLKRCSAQTDATTTTLANVTGLTGQAVAIGTYAFEINLYGTCGGTGGWKVAFNYTTAVLSAINYTALAYSAGNTVAVTSGTTTTTQTSIIAANTAYTNGRIIGTMTVSTAGTVDLQFAENSANSTSSIFVGSTMQFTRIA